MTTAELSDVLTRQGVGMALLEGRLRVTGNADTLTPELQESIREHASALSRRLTLYRRLHHGNPVQTPEGRARVLQVFTNRVTVQLDEGQDVRHFEPEEVSLVR